MVMLVVVYYKVGLSSPVYALIVEGYNRAAPCGVRAIKVAIIYSDNILPNMLGKRAGFPIFLYLDGDNRTVISVLTEYLLSPYLLLSIDRGFGMMRAIAQTAIDYLTWVNHEVDVDHCTVCNHVRSFLGT